MNCDYSPVTELPGNFASAEQLEMIHTRYHWARQHSQDKNVLEVACGPGRGLGYLAQVARSVTGGDYTEALVRAANHHYQGRIKILHLDAQQLPFSDESFDVLMLFEAIYYLPDASQFVAEARRVLRPNGVLLVCSANREWPEFNPSPLSVKYFSALELRELLMQQGFAVELKAGFEASPRTAMQHLIGSIRRLAATFHLIPGSMQGKALFKRFFYGKLAELGPELLTSVPVRPLVSLTNFPVETYKVLYAVGTTPA